MIRRNPCYGMRGRTFAIFLRRVYRAPRECVSVDLKNVVDVQNAAVNSSPTPEVAIWGILGWRLGFCCLGLGLYSTWSRLF